MDTIDLRNKNKVPETESLAEVLKSDNGLAWEAFPKEKNKKNLYIFISALFLASGITLIWSNDPLLAIYLALSSLFLILYSNKKTYSRKIFIDNYGIRAGEDSYLFQEIKSFWIDYGLGEDKELSIEPAKWYLPYIKLGLENKNPLEIRAHLINFIPEKEHQKTLADLINRKLGL